MGLVFAYTGIRTCKILLYTVLNSVLVLCMPLNTYAQTTDSAKIYTVKEVKVTAAQNNARNTSATSAQIIKGADLQRLNSFSVADALRYFSGVQLKDYGGVGGLKTINVRSMGTNNTTVFYDGLQMGNAQNGQIDLGRFSLDNMEEVALYSGQKSAVFQSARSFSAASTIYMRPRRPVFEKGTSSNVKVSFKTGAFGLVNPSLLYEQKINDKVAVSLNGEWVKAHGRYKVYDKGNGLNDTTFVRNNGDVNSYRIEAGLNGVLTDSTEWSLRAYGYDSERGLPGAIVANRYVFTQRQWDRNIFLQGSLQTTEKKRYALKFNAKYANDQLRYLDPEYVTLNGFLDNKFRQNEVYLSLANRLRILPEWEAVLSADYQWNKLDANLYRFPYPTRQTILTALASALRLKDFTIEAVLLNTILLDRVKAFNSAGNKHQLNPSVVASFRPFESKNIMLRAFYKNIFRQPTFNDLYYTFIGNSALKPEHTDQYNFGATYTLNPLNSALTSFSVQADAYYNSVKDKIVAVPSTNLYRWTMFNIGEVAVKGLEVNMQSRWLVSGVVISSSLSYTYQHTHDVTDGANYPYNIPYVPLHSGSLTLGGDWKKFELNYSYIYSGTRYNQLSTHQNAVYNKMEPWYTHDLGLGYRFEMGKKDLKINAELNNILNQYRELILNFPMPGRFFRLNLSYTI